MVKYDSSSTSKQARLTRVISLIYSLLSYIYVSPSALWSIEHYYLATGLVFPCGELIATMVHANFYIAHLHAYSVGD